MGNATKYEQTLFNSRINVCNMGKSFGIFGRLMQDIWEKSNEITSCPIKKHVKF